MTDETDKPEVRPDMMLSEETRAAIAVCTQMLATAERDGVRVLFAPASLEIFQSLYDSDDYWSDDGWPAIRVLEDQVVARFAARREEPTHQLAHLVRRLEGAIDGNPREQESARSGLNSGGAGPASVSGYWSRHHVYATLALGSLTDSALVSRSANILSNSSWLTFAGSEASLLLTFKVDCSAQRSGLYALRCARRTSTLSFERQTTPRPVLWWSCCPW